MLNICIIEGRLVKDPELRKTAQGKSVANCAVANEVGYGDRKTTIYVPCSFYSFDADRLCKFLRKGDGIIVRGELSSRKYTDRQSGQERTVWGLEHCTFEFPLPNARSAQANYVPGYGANQYPSAGPAAAGAPAPAYSDSPVMDTAQDSAINISDDDLPF